MKDIRVSSWNELNDCLYEGSWQEEIGRFRSTCVFRGTADASHDLRTGLSRLGSAAREMEGNILRAFRKYARYDNTPGSSVWNWLALAQHHGLPTRLLDWTYSPFVAMHFATDNPAKYDLDGAIWRVSFSLTNQHLPEQLKSILVEENSYVFTADLLDRAADTLQEFDELGENEFVAFFEPPSLDSRIVNQYALFSLVSSPIVKLDEWLADHPEVFRRIIIPAGLKSEVRDKLDQANITERVLYPGLDGLCRWLKRYYTPS